MHKWHRVLIEFLLLELHTFDLLRKFVIDTFVSPQVIEFQGNDLKLAAKLEYRLGIEVTELQ